MMSLDRRLQDNFSVYSTRRKELLKRIREKNPQKEHGYIVLSADCENERTAFRQESSFYYLTGLEEPGLVMTLSFDGNSVLYVPSYQIDRSLWLQSKVALEQKNAGLFGFNEIKPLGEACPGYQIHLYLDQKYFKNIVSFFKHACEKKALFFGLCEKNTGMYLQQKLFLQRIYSWIPEAQSMVTDISAEIARMRRKKEQCEIELMYKAVEVTAMAQAAAAEAIENGITESEVRASLEYMFIASSARAAFPSIVASGKNSTVLHYLEGDRELVNGDLVIVDIGAEHSGYAADITRTYPVSGLFSARQKEIYSIVLEAQDYIAELARPGYWLSNKEHPAQSLNHLAHEFIKAKGYGAYFPHGVGHYLGLDVHDVGDYTQPLHEGDVITIEPGIYLPKEGLGVRIEDNYWIVSDGVVCLSEMIPKDINSVEKLVQEGASESDDYDA